MGAGGEGGERAEPIIGVKRVQAGAPQQRCTRDALPPWLTRSTDFRAVVCSSFHMAAA